MKPASLHAAHNKIISFIWSIADDCLRDVYVRGKYRDVILPMVVLRRLDALLEPTKEAVLDEYHFQKHELKLAELDEHSLKNRSGYAFYNTSKWTLKTLYQTATNDSKLLLAEFNDYLDGFGENVQEIIRRFNLRSQIKHMADKNVLLDVLAKFVSPAINLSPQAVNDADGNELLPALSNLGMGYVFEELIRRFNEENNEEAGEHFTPREVIELMVHLIFDPLENLPPIITIYDPACGSGGMLTESQNFIRTKYGSVRKIELFGKEVNDETYAICKADMMIREDDPENIRVGSTLSTDEFSGFTFDFMLSNPPYGKSWASEQKFIKDGKDVIDPRFVVKLADHFGNVETVDATPRSSDGQLLFLMEMVSKMKAGGSRIASVHNGSSLFTGDAGSGESNIRRYLLDNDYLEAIVQLPNNLFYNTGIATYIWLLTNDKPAHRKGKVQLIDASNLYRKLRKNLGSKNCEFAPEHIAQIAAAHAAFAPSESETLPIKIFDNQEFCYRKVVIERPDRRVARFSPAAIAPLAHIATDKNGTTLHTAAQTLMDELGQGEFLDFNLFKSKVEACLKKSGIKLTATHKKALYNAVSAYDERGEKVIAKTVKLTAEEKQALCTRYGITPDELAYVGYYATAKAGEYHLYETASDKDSESVPYDVSLTAYFSREVKPHLPDAWMNMQSIKIGAEISFNKYFYRHTPLPALADVAAEIRALEKQTDGLIAEILGG